MEKPIVFVGYRRNLYDYQTVAKDNNRKVVGILDKYFYGNVEEASGVPIIGGEDLLKDKSFVEDHDFFLTSWWDGYDKLDNPEHSGDNLRKTRIKLLEDSGATCANLIHSSCHITEDIKLGQGILVMPYTVISPHGSIGDHSVLDWYVLIGHECNMGKNVIIGARTTLGGCITIEDNVRIGLNATVVVSREQPIVIRKNSKVWAGAVVFDDIPEDSSYTHNHRLLKRLNNATI